MPAYTGSQVEIETNDSVEDVKAALGPNVEIEESQPDVETEDEKPSPKTPKQAKAEPLPDEDPTEDETEDEDDDEPEESDEEPVKKPAPTTVPRSRLNEEIRRRKDAERRLAAREDEPGDEAEPETDSKTPQYFSGEAEPEIEAFTGKVDKFDPEAMAKATSEYMKAHFTWERKEARAEASYNAQMEQFQRKQAEKVAPFVERRDAFAEAEPEYNDVLEGAKDLLLSDYQRDFTYDSEVGPQILFYAAKHPKEFTRIRQMGPTAQSKAMIALEAKLVEQYAVTEDESEEEVPVRRVAAAPIRKPITSKAPAPPTRLKGANPPPRTERELAGPEDRAGIDIEFNPALERAEKARRGT